MRVSNQMGGSRLYKSSKANKEKKIAAQARQASRDSFINSSKSMGLDALRSSLYNDKSSGLSFKQRHDNLQQLRVNYRKASQLMKQEKYKSLKGEKDVWTSLINGEIGEKELDQVLAKMKEEEQKKESTTNTEEKETNSENVENKESTENKTETQEKK